MSDDPDTIQCETCTTTFVVGLPQQYRDDCVTVCATPGCRRRFWHARREVDARVRVGVWPEDTGAPLPRDYGRDENFP